MRIVRPRWFILCFMLLVCWSGCVFGPTALQMSRASYNEAIQRTTNEQLLLNLVRLRYRDVPFVLEVGSVSAQFELRQDASAVGTLRENVGPNKPNPHSLDVGMGVTFFDRPTVTFSPVQGQEFVQRLMTPLTLETIVLLQRSGWSIERVLRLTVQQINGVDNATRATGPTPQHVPPYREFARVCELIRMLQLRRDLAIGYVTKDVPISDPIALTSISGETLITAAKEGYRLMQPDDGKARYVLMGPRQYLELFLSESALESPEVKELCGLLGLAPERKHYEIVQIGTDLIDHATTHGSRDTLAIGTRALLGIMFYLSQGIEVPSLHEYLGLVTVTRDEQGLPFDWNEITGDQLRVRCSILQPRSAAVAVKYRGWWFFVEDSDLDSKATFTLLAQLMSLQAGVESGPGPVLTLPLGG